MQYIVNGVTCPFLGQIDSFRQVCSKSDTWQNGKGLQQGLQAKCKSAAVVQAHMRRVSHDLRNRWSFEHRRTDARTGIHNLPTIYFLLIATPDHIITSPVTFLHPTSCSRKPSFRAHHLFLPRCHNPASCVDGTTCRLAASLHKTTPASHCLLRPSSLRHSALQRKAKAKKPNKNVVPSCLYHPCDAATSLVVFVIIVKFDFITTATTCASIIHDGTSYPFTA